MPSVNFANWAVVPQGIYFLPNGHLSLEFFEFSAKKVTRVMELNDEAVM